MPLAADHSVGIGSVFFGLNADEELAGDLDLLAGGVADAVAELSGLAAPAVIP